MFITNHSSLDPYPAHTQKNSLLGKRSQGLCKRHVLCKRVSVLSSFKLCCGNCQEEIFSPSCTMFKYVKNKLPGVRFQNVEPVRWTKSCWTKVPSYVSWFVSLPTVNHQTPKRKYGTDISILVFFGHDDPWWVVTWWGMRRQWLRLGCWECPLCHSGWLSLGWQ